MADEFDRLMQQCADLPDFRLLASQTVTASPNPLSNERTADYIVQCGRAPDGGPFAFLRYLATDEDGQTVAVRLVLPPKAVALILRQTERLADRSTPDSRARRRRAQDLTTKRKRDHDAGRHTKRPVGVCRQCQKAAKS